MLALLKEEFSCEEEAVAFFVAEDTVQLLPGLPQEPHVARMGELK